MILGWTDRDPTAGVKAYKSKEIHTWNEGEIAAFEKRWPEGSRERLAFALLLCTGQLAMANEGDATILMTDYGHSFSLKGFGNMISTAIRHAGLPGRCKAHGLRKAAARRLAEAGCSASEIAAITGHKTLAEVERYTRAADQERLARQAIQKQSKNRSGKPELDKVANTRDELSKINSLIAKMALPRGLEPLFSP
jgi:enterobacteria phage integrase